PAGAADPVRLEFDGSTIVSMRRFDAGTQRSLEPLTTVRLVPRYEVVVTPDEAPAVAERLRRVREAESGRDETASTRFLFHDGLERFAGHYDQDPGAFTDYLPADTLVLCDGPGQLADRAAEFTELIAQGHAQALEHFPGVSPPDQLFLPATAFAELRRRHAGADFMDVVQSAGAAADYGVSIFIDCRPPEPVQRSIEKLKGQLAELAGHAIEPAILCDNSGQRDRLFELLGTSGARLGVGLVTAGFTVPGAAV